MPIASPRYPFTRTAIEAAPDDHGVYALYQGEELVFLGIAVGAASIKTRLIAHAAALIEPSMATHYAWEIARDPQARLAMLLREYKYAFNRIPRFNNTQLRSRTSDDEFDSGLAGRVPQ
jgi:hypothetical protein